MSSTPPNVNEQALYVASRRVLLDALDALVDQRRAVVLVGAQAVYLQTDTVRIAQSAFTSDADLGLDPDLIQTDPHLDIALANAGFDRDAGDRQQQPGTWWSIQVIDGLNVPIAVDLLTPETLTIGGRGAELPPHGSGAVRRVPGIELALEDHSLMHIASLEPTADDRTFDVHVAGIPALLVAKAYKIGDRLKDGRPTRISDKDASDIYRLVVAANPRAVASALDRLGRSGRVGDTARAGSALLKAQFGAPRSPGVDMAVRALEGSVAEERVRAVLPAFVRELGPN
jgi:hypothetical protein